MINPYPNLISLLTPTPTPFFLHQGLLSGIALGSRHCLGFEAARHYLQVTDTNGHESLSNCHFVNACASANSRCQRSCQSSSRLPAAPPPRPLAPGRRRSLPVTAAPRAYRLAPRLAAVPRPAACACAPRPRPQLAAPARLRLPPTWAPAAPWLELPVPIAVGRPLSCEDEAGFCLCRRSYHGVVHLFDGLPSGVRSEIRLG